MSNILINGLNSNSAGGKSVLTNFLQALKSTDSINQYIVLLTRKEYESELGSLPDNVKLVFLSQLYISPLFIFYTYFFLFRFLETKYEADKVLSFGDLVPLCGSNKLIYYFDWAYAVYPEHEIWNSMTFASKLIRRLKFFQIKYFLPRAGKVIAQTNVIKERLERLYSLKNVKVVNNAVTRNIDGKTHDFMLPNGFKFLYLTRYYPHKNIDILLEVAKLIKEKKLNFKIILTITSEQHDGAKKFLNAVQAEKLSDIIYNIGEVDYIHLTSLYDQIDYLLMPSTLESFSGSYIEALKYKTPILTSNLDFAQEVCESAAYYFNEKNPISIMDTMIESTSNIELTKRKIIEGTCLYNMMDEWSACCSKIIDIINEE